MMVTFSKEFKELEESEMLKKQDRHRFEAGLATLLAFTATTTAGDNREKAIAHAHMFIVEKNSASWWMSSSKKEVSHTCDGTSGGRQRAGGENCSLRIITNAK